MVAPPANSTCGWWRSCVTVVVMLFGYLSAWHSFWWINVHTIEVHARDDSITDVATVDADARSPLFGPPFFMVHIPKTGGASVLLIMEQDLVGAGFPRPAVCNHGVAPVANRTWWTAPGSTCLIHAAEAPYFAADVTTFVMVREPKQHVVSQYFHCTESPAHKDRAHFMPSLDTWLEVWAAVRPNRTIRRMQREFQCYNPVNRQNTNLKSPENETVLSTRFQAVGLTTEMERSTCLFSIRVLGGVVPRRCNCTNRLPLSSKSPVVDHGVLHHGASHNTTQHQANLIDELTKEDQRVFSWAQQVFAKNFIEVQERYDFKMC
mmetsp:Transcript_30786/g.81808  ORF Transcript_30786/g.81808 Transcript_30786/m.81808 type:complete len:320 (-) Transcript_30786:384-1343(-)